MKGMSVDISAFYSTLGDLINAEDAQLIDRSQLIESPRMFLNFCQSRNLSSFLFSMYQKTSFEEIFGLELRDSFSGEFNRTWAASLRWDIIREELHSSILPQFRTEYLFLDPALVLRSINGNRYLMSCSGIQILVATEPTNLQAVMRQSGFIRVYPQYEILAKVSRKIGFSIGAKYFKRNEFLVGINTSVTDSMGCLLEADSLLSGRSTIDISGKHYYTLSEYDSLFYSILNVIDSLLLRYDHSNALVCSYLLMKRMKSGIFGANKTMACKFIENILSLIWGMFEGMKDFVDEESALREAFFGLFDSDSRWQLISDRLNRLTFYLRFSPQMNNRDLFKIMFGLRYF